MILPLRRASIGGRNNLRQMSEGRNVELNLPHYVVFAVMLCRLRKGAALLGFGRTEHSITKAAALPCPELEGRG
jgi:hypothetical protein